MKKNAEMSEAGPLAKTKRAAKGSPGSAVPAKAKTGSRKGVNTFSGYQEAKVCKRLGKVVAVLAALAKKRARFDYITDLAKEVAERLSNPQDGNCSVSTLVRNDVYRAKLAEYMASQSGASSVAVARRRRGQLDPKTEAEVMNTQLEMSNLRAELARLRLYAGQLERQLGKGATPPSANEENADLRAALNACQADLANSNKAISLILANFESLIAFDEEGNVCDLSKRVNQIIVPSFLLGLLSRK